MIVAFTETELEALQRVGIRLEAMAELALAGQDPVEATLLEEEAEVVQALLERNREGLELEKEEVPE